MPPEAVGGPGGQDWLEMVQEEQRPPVLTAPSRGRLTMAGNFLTRPRTLPLSGDVGFTVIVRAEPAGDMHSSLGMARE